MNAEKNYQLVIEPDSSESGEEYNEESVSEMEDDAVHVKFSSGWDDAISCSDSDFDDNSAVYNQYCITKPPVTQADAVAELLGEDVTESTDGKVLYYTCSCVSKTKKELKLISHKDITPELIKRGFYEIVGNHIESKGKVYSQKHIRLFFDVDIKNDAGALALYNTILDKLDKLKSLFGDYSISGYTNNETIVGATKCRLNNKAGKALSLHITFYESRLTITDLIALCSKNNFILPDWIDDSVYGIGKRRVFRHHQSPHTSYGIAGINKNGNLLFNKPFQLKNKDGKLLYNDDGTPKMSKPDKYCPGAIFDDKPIHTQILQPLGTEKLISLDDVINSGLWFDIQPNVNINDVKVIVSKHKIANYLSSGYIGKLVDTKVLNAIMKEVIDDTVETNNDAAIDCISSVNCLKYLLRCYNPTFANLQHVFWLVIVSGPYDKKTLKEIVKEWYWKGEHSTPDGDADFIDNNYVTVGREVSDIWFYCAVKHLPDAVKDTFIKKYGRRSVDTTVKFDVWDNFALNNLQKNIINHKYTVYCAKTVSEDKTRKNALKLPSEYSVEKMKNEDGSLRSVTVKRFPVINFGRILTDLRRCFVIIDSTPRTYIFKGFDGYTGKMCIDSTMHTKIAKDKLKSITVKYLDNDMKTKSIDLWTLVNYDNNSSYMSYLAAEFYSTNPDVFSYYYPSFQQCAYDTIDPTKTDYKSMNNLERWVHHVNDVICAGDEEAIQYIHGWIARPLQNPLKKNKTALVVKDINQGTGKSWFAEMVAHLHGKFGNDNVGNMKTICGDFNGSIDNQTLIVVNEVNDVDNSVYYNGDRLKTLITEDSIEIERKGIDAEKRRIFANFIFVSNNEMPIRVDDKDRRYMILRPSAVHGKDDRDYWSDDFYNLKDDNEFLSQLYSYYMNLDIGYYNPTAIPVTLAKEEIIEQARPRIHDFIIDNYSLLVKGWDRDYAFDEWLVWCKRKNYQNPGNIRTFNNNISEYVEWTYQKANGQSKAASRTLPKKQINGKRVYIYKLNEESVGRFKSMDDDMICSDGDGEVNTIGENVRELTD